LNERYVYSHIDRTRYNTKIMARPDAICDTTLDPVSENMLLFPEFVGTIAFNVAMLSI
jgi:hypothetical protein